MGYSGSYIMASSNRKKEKDIKSLRPFIGQTHMHREPMCSLNDMHAVSFNCSLLPVICDVVCTSRLHLSKLQCLPRSKKGSGTWYIVCLVLGSLQIYRVSGCAHQSLLPDQ